MGRPTDEVRRGKMLAKTRLRILLLLMLGSSAGLEMMLSAPSSPSTVTVGSFRKQFRPGFPRPGWRYLWNESAEIGRTNGYRDLVWNGRDYGSDENPEFPRAAPAGWVNISRVGGHPGHGKQQGADFDIYAIAAFTVTDAGSYVITNSFVMRDDGDHLGDINLRVFVNEQSIGPQIIVNTKTHQPFDRSLGTLQRGDTLYVAIGPNGRDYNDHFVMDFSIVIVRGD